jgi:two-component system chemotaxis sensor kinase CheA
MILAWRLEPTRIRLRRIAEQAEALAARLGKGPIAVDIESNELRLAPERWASFWSAAVHVVRNAIDHGLGDPEARSLAKQAGGRLVLRTRLQDDAFTIEFSDNGRGIAWDAVKRKAASLGLPTRTRADLVQALFADGLSTRDSVTDVSGRGIGLGAARSACQELGGTVEVESEEGQGTTIRFVWPAKSLSASVARSLRPSRPPSGLERAS